MMNEWKSDELRGRWMDGLFRTNEKKCMDNQIVHIRTT